MRTGRVKAGGFSKSFGDPNISAHWIVNSVRRPGGMHNAVSRSGRSWVIHRSTKTAGAQPGTNWACCRSQDSKTSRTTGCIHVPSAGRQTTPEFPPTPPKRAGLRRWEGAGSTGQVSMASFAFFVAQVRGISWAIALSLRRFRGSSFTSRRFFVVGHHSLTSDQDAISEF